MSTADLRKWDALYREGAYSERRHPTALLASFADQFGEGSALDVAAGAGRNSLFLAQTGFEVDALDISAAGLDRLREDAAAQSLRIRAFEADLEQGLPDALPLKSTYDLIVMIRYVNQPLLEALTRRLADGGIIVCEQHLQTTQEVVGPRNPAFRLAPGELLDAASDLRIHFYREAIVTDPDGKPAALAQLIASHNRSEFRAE